MREAGGDRRGDRWLAAIGAVLAALAVALAAYAAHAASPEAQSRLQLAAVFAFGHGVALAALAPRVQLRTGRIALWMLAAGVLLFSGSLAGHVFAAMPTTFAPPGGMLMIAGWLLHAISALRDKGDA
jgi:uncharacterized membrane protein YgdD (TMEM256/DUF423 family)